MDDEAYYLSQIPSPRATRIRPKKISGLLSKVLTKYGVASQQASDALQKKWGDIVGAEIFQASRLGNIQRNSLFIAVENNLVAQELHMRKREILQAFQKDPLYADIRDLKVRIGM